MRKIFPLLTKLERILGNFEGFGEHINLNFDLRAILLGRPTRYPLRYRGRCRCRTVMKICYVSNLQCIGNFAGFAEHTKLILDLGAIISFIMLCKLLKLTKNAMFVPFSL